MTKREKLIVTAYTGILMTEFDEFQQFAEQLLGRPVYTHELLQGDMDTIKGLVHDEFIQLCESEDS